MHLYQIGPLVYKHEVNDGDNSSKKIQIEITKRIIKQSCFVGFKLCLCTHISVLYPTNIFVQCPVPITTQLLSAVQHMLLKVDHVLDFPSTSMHLLHYQIADTSLKKSVQRTGTG